MINSLRILANLEDTTRDISTKSVFIGGLTIIVLTLLSILLQKREQFKKPLFFSIAFMTLLVTFILAGSTVYLNVKSESGGPVHWHADFEFWACETEIGLRDPSKFLSNKIGTTTYHEHDDKRIHLEGVVLEKSVDASLGKFLSVVGGDLSSTSISIPVNSETDYLETEKTDGDISQKASLAKFITKKEDHATVNLNTNTDSCPDEDESEVQVFVYKTLENDDTKYYQKKLNSPATYTIAEEDQIPTGDCVIFEYGSPKDKTDKICKQYGVRDIDGCEDFGVTPEARSICTMTQIEEPEGTEDA